MRRACIAAALVALALLASSADALAGPNEIVAAENFYGDLARQIGGDHVRVTTILSNPDSDPHLFETSPSTARAVSRAGIVIFNGAGYDAWMTRLLAAAPKEGRLTLDAAALSGHEHSANPHIWYDPEVLPAVAKALAQALERHDPENAGLYRSNLGKFLASLEPVHSRVAEIKARHAGTAVTATEPVFGYMAHALGFRMLNEGFQLATMNGTEPSPSQVAAFEDSLKDGSAKLLFYNSQVADAATGRLLDIARKNHVPVIGVTETEPAGKTLQQWFGEQLDRIADALEPRGRTP